MNQYKKFNNITGWSVFAIAAFVFLSTIEPTGSFWDCGEFIACANKLQVGHPPGASLFLMTARVAILFAGGDVTLMPVMVNALSAVASAFAVLFLFWTITAFTKKIVKADKDGNYTTAQLITIMGSGMVGALAYTFTDSFWFSAVEGEVYATSQFFTAIVFWAMMKWESVANERHADRWIILIAYLMGLSIGIHLLNLLCIPALAFIYYFKKYPVTRYGLIKTAVVGVMILAIVQYGIIAGLVSIGAKFDLLFVNSFGLPFWTGFLFFIFLIVGGIVFGLRYTERKNKPILNTAILCFAFILIGYSSYAQVVLRSMANPPMDENNPENAYALLGYINREQYGDRPLGYGQYYNAKVVDQEDGPMSYAAMNGKYIETGNKIIPVYEKDKCTVFPRMFSNQENHISAYKEWAGIKGEATPTFAQNMKFFFSYQIGHMFWRYFMWNFVGRQNDIQGHGGIIKGNWLSGIKGIDAVRLGPQDHLPKSMTQNKAMNKFYFLPLILGLIGMIYQFKKDQRDGFIVLMLFIMTGLAIVVYLNQTPYQPRERDYAYAGAFYAFAIWIGLAVAALTEWISKSVPRRAGAPAMTLVCLLLGPVMLAKDGWNDHDRSHRYTSRDFAANYLNSCAPNAIIFTNGDNDTFPLWYAQEVEGVRTDVRVVNLSLLNTDWYIDQMKRKAYTSDPVPFTWTYDKYVQGTRDYVPFYDRKVGTTNLKDVMDFITSDASEAKARTQGGNEMNYFPTKSFTIPVNAEEVLKNGVVAPEDAGKIVKSIDFAIGKNYLMKADLMILDLIAHNNWTRPIYFAVTVGNESYLNLEEYFQLEGLAYRFVPIRSQRTADGQTGSVGVNQMYDNMMNKFVWGNMKDPRVYLDQNNLNMTMNFRNNFSRLAESLLASGKRDSSLKTLDRCLEVMPDKTVPYNIMMLRIIENYYDCAKAGTANDSSVVPTSDIEKSDQSSAQAIQKANSIVKRLADIYEDDLHYYFSLKGTEYVKGVDRDMNQAMAVFQELQRLTRQAKQTQITTDLEKRFKELEKKYYGN
ncbi:MAG TPA: DUF2723 domain-containing protein [Bacteroidia bacterium]|nr:DUF2723 domain-containing protein [Bacteroidia bacterium]